LERFHGATAHFIQIESTYSRLHKGTGLGLLLYKDLIELHGGHLDFQSDVGAGSIVNTRFPKKRVGTSRVIAKNSAAV
jgi:signal transduction histidine kinase